MVWLMRSKALRKPVVLVGAACTSVFLGVMVFDRILSSPQQQQLHFLSQSHNHSPHSSPRHSKHCSSCTNSSMQPSYAKLKKYEATRFFKNSVIKRLDVVFLGSNSPIEDRFVVGTSENLGGTFFSMIDGHKGTHCSQFLQENMLQHVSAHLHERTGPHGQDDLQILLDMDLVEREALARNSEQSPKATVIAGGEGVADTGDDAESAARIIEEGLRESLASLDDKISKKALEEVKLILSGHSMTPEMKETIMSAVDGACSLTAMVRQHDIIVANTGDCRVVLGQRAGGPTGGNFKPLPLSEDQNAMNAKEVERVRTSHPGEETVIFAGRVLGGLMPFRTFGDIDYKWERKYLQGILPMVPNYKTPPYVTAEPVMSRHQLSKEDKFVIIATDGFWERVGNQDAVDTVAGLTSRSSRGRKRSLKGFLGGKSDPAAGGDVAAGDDSSASIPPCCKVNAATELLWLALGGREELVAELLRLDPKISRMHRDDITIMVLHL